MRCLTVFLCSLPALAAGGEARRVWNLLAAMALGYASVGLLNDYCDRDLDRQTKPWRAIPSGLVSPRLALALTLLCAAGMALAAWPFGGLSVTLLTLAIACGWLYDLRLKRTAFSWLPFVVFFPLVPMWVWTSLAGFEPRLWALFPLVALPAFAMHLFNNLEDVDADRAAGWDSGLPHRLGRRSTARLAWALLAASYLLCLAWAARIPPALLPRYGLLTGAALLPALLAGGIFLLRPDRQRLRRAAFTLLATGILILSTGFPLTLN